MTPASQPAPISPPHTSVRIATSTDIKAVAHLVADAFDRLPLTNWLVPDPGERARVLPANFEILVEHAIAHGVVHVNDDRTAAAVWLTGAPDGVPEIGDYDRRMASICGPYIDRFTQLDEAMHRGHPTGPTHAHLVFLAVAPHLHGRGLGTALLDHHHEHLDQHGVPAYLEASSLASRALYLRHGYQPHGEPFTVADGPNPAMWPMWRHPKSTG